jgi:hypothetical protein
MIKRLLSSIRHMREPTFDDPKAARWADIFQKRARLTGQLPESEVLQKMGIPAADPFWKQDNANPSAGFAVNLGSPVAAALATESAANFKVAAVDDFGRSVTRLPLSKTAPKFFFHVSNSIFPLEGASGKIAPNEFVWRVAQAFRDLLLKLESESDEPEDDEDNNGDEQDEEETMSFDPTDYTISRVTWSKSLGAWYVITDQTGADEALDTSH